MIMPDEQTIVVAFSSIKKALWGEEQRWQSKTETPARTTDQIFQGRKVVFGVPGGFHPLVRQTAFARFSRQHR
jgi:peroxiredoxin